MNIFTLDPAVKKLLGWKISDEEEKWSLKAIESLVKKMRKRKYLGIGTVEDLEYALAHPGSRSKCVTIPRSLDGRLQVSHRKALPHVIYCRVWRWPTLQSHHELKSTPECQFPYTGRNEQICINPYHYMRVELATKPNNLLPQQQQQRPCLSHILFSRSVNFPSTSSPSPMPTLLNYSNGIVNQCSSLITRSPFPAVPHSLFGAQLPSPQQLPQSQQLLATSNGNCNFLGPNSQSASSPSTASPSSSLAQSPSVLSDDDDFRRVAPPTFQFMFSKMPMTNEQPSASTPTPIAQPSMYWCSISYYELNSRVGEPFKVNKNAVVIDGFTAPFSESPTEERICLGLLSNVNRNATIENTRKHIGRGIRLNCTDSQITLFNAANTAIFIQSRNANFKFSLQSTAVCRVPPQSTMLVFDFYLFGEMLERAKLEGFSHVYELQKMCFVRLSFVKGWGADYHRKDVTSTPCWLELQLHRPLAWIDSILSRLEPQNMDVTSVS